MNAQMWVGMINKVCTGNTVPFTCTVQFGCNDGSQDVHLGDGGVRRFSDGLAGTEGGGGGVMDQAWNCHLSETSRTAMMARVSQKPMAQVSPKEILALELFGHVPTVVFVVIIQRRPCVPNGFP